MSLVRDLVTDALMEIGVIAPGETLSNDLGALGLLRFQQQMDSWQADRLTLAFQNRVTFTLVSGTSSVTIGPGGSVTTTPATTTAPRWLDTVTYVNPAATGAAQEVKIGQMDRDTYARLTIKQLPSALPLQCFYQMDMTDALGTLFLWPQVTQNVTIVLYSPLGAGVPVTLDDVVIGPPSYAEAYMRELALRLCPPTGTAIPDGLPQLASAAKMRMSRPNVIPATMGVDPAVTTITGAGYNILSDVMQTAR